MAPKRLEHSDQGGAGHHGDNVLEGPICDGARTRETNRQTENQNAKPPSDNGESFLSSLGWVTGPVYMADCAASREPVRPEDLLTVAPGQSGQPNPESVKRVNAPNKTSQVVMNSVTNVSTLRS
jgi:hypothetical protein